MKKYTSIIFLTFVLTFLAFNSSALAPSEQDAVIVGDSLFSRSNASTYSTGLWDLDYSNLRGMVGGGSFMNYGNFSNLIENYFLPLGIHYVGLHIGWDDHANTSTKDMPYWQWIDDWLKASDEYGIANVFYIRQFGVKNTYWDDDVIAEYPELQQYNSSGLPMPLSGSANPVDVTNPLVLTQYKEDLKQLYEYYGEHPSWVGIGTFDADKPNVASSDPGVVKEYGFRPDTIKKFRNSVFYARDVDSNGFHPDGTKDKIWDMFQDLMPYSTIDYNDNGAPAGFPTSVSVYGGTASGGRVFALRFKAPDDLDGFQIRWRGFKVNSPPDLTLELYRDVNGIPANIGNPIERKTQSSTSISAAADWQSAVPFTSKLAFSDYYWIVFSTGGDASNYYAMNFRRERVDDAFAKYSTNGYLINWDTNTVDQGSASLFLLDSAGRILSVYPYIIWGNWDESGSATWKFTPEKDMTVNTVFLYISDRGFVLPNGTLQITRVSDGSLVGTGTLSLAELNGLYKWVPIKLNSQAQLIKGIEYRFRVISDATPNIWKWAIGFFDIYDDKGNPRREYLFKLANIEIPAELRNFDHYDSGSTGFEVNPNIQANIWTAVRFTPSVTTTLYNVSVYIDRISGSPSGNLRAALQADDGTGRKPNGVDIRARSISSVSTTGWYTVTDFDASLQANTNYWIVFSTPGSSAGSGYDTLGHSGSAKIFYQQSQDGGQTWRPPQGGYPSDLLWKAEGSAGLITPPLPERVIGLATGDDITNTGWNAQSFTPSRPTQVKGVLVHFGKRPDGRVSGGDIIVEIRDNSVSNTPSSNVLISKKVLFSEIVSPFESGLRFIEFDMPIDLGAGQRYWIVLRATKPSASSLITQRVVFYRTPAQSYGGLAEKLLRTTNSGNTWSPITKDGMEGDMLFAIVSPPTQVSIYSTPDIAEDFRQYHAFSIWDAPLKGWNVFLNSYTIKLMKDATKWFEGYSGKKQTAVHSMKKLPVTFFREFDFNGYSNWGGNLAGGPLDGPITDNNLFYSDCEKKVLPLLKLSDTSIIPWWTWGRPGDNSGYINSDQIGIYYRVCLPVLARSFGVWDVDATNLKDNTKQVYSRSFGEILNRMRYSGGYFGSESSNAPRVLMIGDREVGITPQFLTPALNITMEGFLDLSRGDTNLTKFGDFSQFDVILWYAGRPAPTEISVDAQNRIRKFIQDGGGFVSLVGPISWLPSATQVPNSHPIFRPYTSFVDNPPSVSEFTLDNGRGISITLKRNIGRTGNDPTILTIYGAPKDSMFVIINNAVFYAAKKENMLPVWWYKDYRDLQPWNSETFYSISGKPGNILVWLSNNLETDSPFEMHLSASFYGIDSNGWIVWDAASGQVLSTGTGNDINIALNVPAKSWKPLYIFNSSDAHSNVFITSQSTTSNQKRFILRGSYKQPKWLVYQSNQRPTSVKAGTLTLNETTPANLLTTNGWNYDDVNKVVYVRYVE